MDEITETTKFELTTFQEYGEALFATSVAFGASLAAKKVFKEVVKLIHNHRASK